MQVLFLLIPRNSNDACCSCFKASFFLLCDALPSVLFFSCFHFLTIIAGMGFGQGMTSICRGKAANQSTLAVIFGRTFSGSQGAVRLHKLYAESKHGRTKFQKIVCTGVCKLMECHQTQKKMFFIAIWEFQLIWINSIFRPENDVL